MIPYPFQQYAIDKLTQPKIISRLLGDDMGLGKTPQALWIDKKNRQEYRAEFGWTHLKTLIIGSHIVLQDAWLPTIAKIAPNAKVAIINPKNRGAFIKALRDPTIHYYLVHWEGVRLIRELQEVRWFHIIADEAHRIKNRKTKVTYAVKALTTRYKTAISGTPADDKPQDLWSIVHWLWPQYYRSYWKFVGTYCQTEEEKNWGSGDSYRKVVGVQNVSQLHKDMEPWFVRRLKSQVAHELPDKTYSDYWVELTPGQRKAYNQMRDEMITWVGQHENDVLVAPVVIAQLCRLQQFAIASINFDTQGRVVLCDPSSKLDAFSQILEDNPTSQFVVFSQFKGAINLLGQRLSRAKMPHALLTGDVKPQDRGPLVESFQRGDTQVFASTIATGGEGITLTSASTVVFLDRSWRPTSNRQAEDRLHRIGQQNAVQIIDIMARDTVDLGRRQTILMKWNLIQQILGDDKLQRTMTADDPAAEAARNAMFR